ncbi:hypothetical protein UPYG_G00101380 [Umbra pygmaea]|uniref:Uncharacterized protein n=1 Tax=Umbra pygmaea TaxID=75934 RepID=A0ABD0X188_UMBPY
MTLYQSLNNQSLNNCFECEIAFEFIVKTGIKCAGTELKLHHWTLHLGTLQGKQIRRAELKTQRLATSSIHADH